MYSTARSAMPSASKSPACDDHAASPRQWLSLATPKLSFAFERRAQPAGVSHPSYFLHEMHSEQRASGHLRFHEICA